MLATDNWCIKVAEKVFGPYTQDEMAAFAAEGRLSGRSLVAAAGGKTWREARLYPSLSVLFEHRPRPTKAFGRASTGGEPAALEEGALANFIVIFDVTAGTAGRVEHIVRTIGDAFRVTDNVWCVASTQSALGIKNMLSPHLPVREPVFIIDCSRGRTSWHNFVPELHARLTRAWVRTAA